MLLYSILQETKEHLTDSKKAKVHLKVKFLPLVLIPNSTILKV